MFLTPVMWALLSMLLWTGLVVLPPATLASASLAAPVFAGACVLATLVVYAIDRRQTFPVPPRIWALPRARLGVAAAIAGLGITLLSSEVGNIVASLVPTDALIDTTGPSAPSLLEAFVLGVLYPICLVAVAHGVSQRALLLTPLRPWVIIIVTVLIASVGDLFWPWAQRVLMLGLPAWIYMRSLSLGLALCAAMPGRLISAAIALGWAPGVPGFDLTGHDVVLWQPIWLDVLGGVLVAIGVQPLLRAFAPSGEKAGEATR